MRADSHAIPPVSIYCTTFLDSLLALQPLTPVEDWSGKPKEGGSAQPDAQITNHRPVQVRAEPTHPAKPPRAHTDKRMRDSSLSLQEPDASPVMEPPSGVEIEDGVYLSRAVSFFEAQGGKTAASQQEQKARAEAPRSSKTPKKKRKSSAAK